jgi:radical SAM protein with 4Fe4S-binding SPASM domain
MSTIRRFPRMVSTGLAYLRGSSAVSQPPLYYWIEPTSACNLRCRTCATSYGLARKSGMMDWGLFTRIIDEISAITPVVNLHHSGEPLLHPRIADMTRYARERGCFVGYFTNATRLDAQMRKAILDDPPDWLGFSFDGYDRKTYERVRQGASWDLALGNIEGILIERHQRRQVEPYTYLSVVELPENRSGTHQRAAFRTHLKSLGLNQLSTANTHNWAGKVDIEGLTSEAGHYTKCPAPWSGTAILWDGRVVPCCMDVEAQWVVGDIREQRVAEIWNGPAMIRLRRAIHDRHPERLSLCNNCHVLQDASYFGVPRRVWQEAFDVLRTEFSPSIFRRINRTLRRA